METDAAVAEAVQAVEEGIRTIKLKIGREPDRDVDLVRQVRAAVGDGVALRVDANQGYSTAKIGLQVTRRMEQYGIWFMEQPVRGSRAWRASRRRSIRRSWPTRAPGRHRTCWRCTAPARRR